MVGDPQDGPPHVLILEQDAALRRLLSLTLTDEGFRVTAPEALDEAVALVAKHQPDALLLDPGAATELSTLEEIKDRFGLPVLVLTDQSSEEVRAEAFRLGADDLLLKAQEIDEVASRIRFLLANPEERGGATKTLVFGKNRIEINQRHRRVERNGEEVIFAKPEWAILRALMERAGEPCFDGELLVKAFGHDYRLESDYLVLWIGRLRTKLGDDPNDPVVICRYHGAGYVLAAEEISE